MLDEWVVQSHLKLVRNPHYWDNANNKLDEVWFYPTEDLRRRELQRYRAGELDHNRLDSARPARLDSREPARRARHRARISAPITTGSISRGRRSRTTRTCGARWRSRSTATSSPKQILGAGQIPAFGWVPPVTNYTAQQMPEATWTQAEREAEAKRLYAEAGYSPTIRCARRSSTTPKTIIGGSPLRLPRCGSSCSASKRAITNQEWKVFIDTRNQKKTRRCSAIGWIGDYNDAFTFAELLSSTSGQNDTGYNNPEYDRLVGAAQSELDLDKRAVLLQDAERSCSPTCRSCRCTST